MSDDENKDNAINPDEWLAAQLAQGDQAVAAAGEIARIIASFFHKLEAEGFGLYERLELAKVYLTMMLGGGRS